jgi:hypothetical protein
MRDEVIVIGLGLAFFVSGCASTYNRKAKEQVREKASFQLECDPDELTLDAVNKQGLGFKTSFAVKGCGKRAVYSDPKGPARGATFYMESASGDVRTNSEGGGGAE